MHNLHVVNRRECLLIPVNQSQDGVQCGMGRRSKKKQKKLVHFMPEWREFRGLTQEAAAEAMNMSRENLSKLERGLIFFTEESLRAAARAYACAPADLFNPPERAKQPALPAPALPEIKNGLANPQLLAEIARKLLFALEPNEIVARELSQSVVLCYAAAHERGIEPQDDDGLDKVLATELRRLVALSA